MVAKKKATTKKTTMKKATTKKTAVEEPVVEEIIVEESNSDEGAFTLPRSMEISGIEKVYQDMLTKLKNTYTKFVINGGEIAIVDSAGIQLLVHFIRSLKATGCEVSWEDYSVQVYQVAAELSLDDQLGE